MTLATALMLFVAGIGGGVLTSLVGGAAVITYPALIATGLPPHTAVCCNMVASFPGSFFAALSDRRQLPPLDRAFAGMIVASCVGAALGALLLLATPQRVFAFLVPPLLGFATVLFAFAGPIGNWLRARAEARGRSIDFSVTNLKMLLPVSFYGGYFGAGVGVLILAVMSIATRGDYRSANVAKNLVTSLNTGAAAVIFIAKGAVIWLPALVMMAGTIIGGQIGAALARIAPRHVMRIAVTAVGALLTAYFAWAYWF
ncbi:MAG TPA: sulfite exporter TauE/SafE family protein [Pseudolabrys sp.]|nr:sulfite exporter TauE/SafE family protein [Pseudolabrys sp.]